VKNRKEFKRVKEERESKDGVNRKKGRIR